MTLRQAQGERFGDTAARLYGAAAMILGWRPGEFWAATPAELAGALAPAVEGEAPDKGTVEALMQRFPDR